MGINWNMASAALILFGIAWSLHHFKDHIQFGKSGKLLSLIKRNGKGPDEAKLKARYERLLAAVVMLGTGSAVIAAAGTLGPVWAWAQANVLLLLGAGILLAIWVYHMMVRGNRHHVTRTTAIAALFGGVMALIWGGWTGLGTSTGRALKTLQSTSGRAIAGNAAPLSGHGHAVASRNDLPAIVLLGVAGLLLLTVAGSYRKEKNGKKPKKTARTARSAAASDGAWASQ